VALLDNHCYSEYEVDKTDRRVVSVLFFEKRWKKKKKKRVT
jgi:hypothetical protein